MRDLSLNLNIRLSPTPEFMQLASMLVEGLKSLSVNGDPDAPFIEVKEQEKVAKTAQANPVIKGEAKTAQANPVIKGEAKAVAEAILAAEAKVPAEPAPVPAPEVEESDNDELSAESLRALVITKAKQSEAIKDLISATIKSYGVANVTQIATLPEDKRKAFRNTILAL